MKDDMQEQQGYSAAFFFMLIVGIIGLVGFAVVAASAF